MISPSKLLRCCIAALVFLELQPTFAQDVSNLPSISGGDINATTHGIWSVQARIPNYKSAVIRFFGVWYIYGPSDNRPSGAGGQIGVPAAGDWPAPHAAEGCVIVRVDSKNFGCPTAKDQLADSVSRHPWEKPPIFQMVVPGPGNITFQVNDNNVDDNRGAIHFEVFLADCSTCRPPPPPPPPPPPQKANPSNGVVNNNCQVGTPGLTGACDLGGAWVTDRKAYCKTNCPAGQHGFCSPFKCESGHEQDAICGCAAPAGPGVIVSIPLGQ